MIEHYAPLVTSIKTLFGYKSSSLLGASFYSALGLEAIAFFWNGTHLGVSTALLSITALLILVDWGFGSAASKKLAEDAVSEDDKEKYEKHKFTSIKISHTIFKFIALYLWLLLSFSATQHTQDIPFFGAFVDILSIVPILLFGFREYISIGEAMEILHGHKPYIFELGEKIFDALQFKFLKRLKNED